MEANAYESPRTPGNAEGTSGRSDHRKSVRFLLLLGFYLLAAIAGIMGTGQLRSGVVHFLFSIMAASVATYWCVLDARILGRPIVQSVHWIMFFTWPLAVPIYLIRSRGLRGLGMVVLHGIGFVVVAVVAYHTAGYLVYGALWFERLGF